MERMRALSVCQLFAEQNIRGTKTIEYRSKSTNIRGRVYVYASKTPRPIADWDEIDMQPVDLPMGVLVGSVEVVGCPGSPSNYKWALANPRRLAKPRKPKNRPQPVWFYPF